MPETTHERDRPNGPISGLLYDHGRRLRASSRHGTAEGHDVSPRVVLDSYDRTLHPWIHGCRPHDLVEKARDWWSR